MEPALPAARGVTETLADFLIDPPSGFLTTELAQTVEERFLDTIAVMIAGASSPASRIILETIKEAGGPAETTIVGTAEKSSLIQAGFVNGVSAHALEYDDLTPDITHLSSSMVPGCLAVAERCDLSGKQLVEAFALGFEVAGRIALGMKSLAMLDRGFHTPGIIGGLGVSAAASRLMGLDAMSARMAIGLMASSGTGIRKNVGSAGKAFHIGKFSDIARHAMQDLCSIPIRCLFVHPSRYYRSWKLQHSGSARTQCAGEDSALDLPR